MENCIHELVCKHNFSEGDGQECSLKDICKFAPAGMERHIPERGPHKKRKYKKRDKGDRGECSSKSASTPGIGRKQRSYLHLTTSDKDIRRGRQILLLRQARGSLTDDQSAALNMHKDKKIKDLAEHERQQILNIFKDTEQE